MAGWSATLDVDDGTGYFLTQIAARRDGVPGA